MNNLPREMLRRILAKYGKEICNDARRCEGLLNDLCGAYRREINVLVNAIDERVPLDLLAGSRSMPLELLLNRLEKRLEDQTGLTAEAARWAVESWALALGAATEADIEARARRNFNPPLPKTETTPPPQAQNKPANQNFPNTNRSGRGLPPKQQTSAPLPKTAPPISRPPIKIPHSPPVYLPKNNQPLAPTPKANPQTQPPNPAPIPKRRFGIFRGCLIVIFLLIVSSIVVFLGVPYAIEVMRETQRERGEEAPRFPVR